MAGTEDEDRDADEIEHHGRAVEHVIGPIAPTREEPVEVAEEFFSPEVDTALAGIAVCEFDDRDALRQEKQQQGEDTKVNGDAAVSGDRGHDVEVEDCDDEEEYEVATAQNTLEVN